MIGRMMFLASLGAGLASPAAANQADRAVVQDFMHLAGEGKASANQRIASGAKFQDGDLTGQLDASAYRDKIKGCNFVEFGLTKATELRGKAATIVETNWDCLNESGSVLLPIGFVFTVQSGKIVRMELTSQ